MFTDFIAVFISAFISSMLTIAICDKRNADACAKAYMDGYIAREQEENKEVI